jgi:hypothetical protein
MLGRIATDTVNGLKGVVIAKAEFLYSPMRIEVMPTKLDKGKSMKGVWLDEARTKIGAVKIKVKSPTPTVKLGEEVVDSLTGFKGVATGRYTFLNGCMQIEVSPKELKDGKPIEPSAFDEQRLTPKSKVTTGGPHDNLPNYSRP